MLKAIFAGANRTVTGSMHYFEYTDPTGSKFNFCVDAGMFQVGQKVNLFRINSHLLFDPKKLDALILTHAHLDHCGRIPYLVKMGFGGKIYSNLATKKIAEIVMTDATKHQKENAKLPEHFFDVEGMKETELNETKTKDSFEKLTQKHNFLEHLKDDQKKVNRVLDKYSDLTLYEMQDVEQTMNRFQTFEYHKKFKIHPNLEVQFFDAGHILGSSYLIITEISTGRKIAMSGDIGNPGKPIIEDPEKPPKIQNLTHIYLESTYGNRVHPKLEPKARLKKIIRETYKKGGKVLIPSFSIERAQEVIYFLVELIKENKIPHMPIFLDSPMATKMLDVCLEHPELYDKEMKEKIDQKANPFKNKNLKITETVEQSKQINSFKKPCIIIAGSGMLNGGRILKHLKQYIEEPETTLLFVGFQATGTLGRKILDGQSEVEVEGKKFPVKNNIELITEFSAHADKNGLKNWVHDLIQDQDPSKEVTVFLVHGEKEASLKLGEELEWLFRKRVKYYWPHFSEEMILWK